MPEVYVNTYPGLLITNWRFDFHVIEHTARVVGEELRKYDYTSWYENSDTGLQKNKQHNKQAIAWTIISNLPAWTGPLYGRDEDKEALSNWFKDSGDRLMTVRGITGVGKSLLALSFANNLKNNIEGRVVYVDARPLSQLNEILTKFCDQLKGPKVDGADMLSYVRSATFSKDTLLLVDNFDHFASTMSDPESLFADLLSAAQELRIIATSTVLQVSTIGSVRVLRPFKTEIPRPFRTEIPRKQPTVDLISAMPAVKIFINYRTKAKHGVDFVLTADNIDDVIKICNKVSGIALGIRVLASTLPREQPRDVLKAYINTLKIRKDRVDSLYTENPLEILAAAINTNYDLLNLQQQGIFKHLSLLHGSFTAETVVEVFAEYIGTISLQEVKKTLDLLVDRSLLDANDDDSYYLLNALQDFGLREVAKQADAVVFKLLQDYSQYFVQIALSNEHFSNPPQSKWLDQIGDNLGNIRALLPIPASEVVDDNLATDTEGFQEILFNPHNTRGEVINEVTQLVVATALWQFWWRRGLAKQGVTYLELLLFQNAALRYSSKTEDVEKWADAAFVVGHLNRHGGFLPEAKKQYEDSLEAYRRIKHRQGQILVLTELAVWADHNLNYSSANQYVDEALTLCKLAEPIVLIEVASVSYMRGNLLRSQKRFEEARESLQEAHDLFNVAKDGRMAATAQLAIGNSLVGEGKLDEAQSYYGESLGYFSSNNDTRITLILERIAALAAKRKHYERAAHLHGQSNAIRVDKNSPLPRQDYQDYYDDLLNNMKENLGEATFLDEEDRGSKMAIKDAVKEAFDEVSLSH